MKKIAGINGFGRFGLHLLKYWLDRASSSNFNIGYINDDTITIDQALDTLHNDNKVFFTKYRFLIFAWHKHSFYSFCFLEAH
mgnify:CR=1 FL=1